MPVSICPRCKHVNPEFAVYCYFDGVILQSNQNIAAARLPNPFVFPSGRRCQTFDELAQGCQEEWTAARDLLIHGIFANFFQNCNRADLVTAANDARAQANPDIALMTFLAALPGTRTQTPKLDLQPKRILLGNLLVGEKKSASCRIVNQGQGMLQGTVSITEGQDWLSLSETAPLHTLPVSAVRDQAIAVYVNTKGVAAGQTYGAKLTVVTNGGVGEIPLRMDLAPRPFAKPPFQGVRTQRELAEKMRLQAKQAGPVLESGDVQRWFALNGWTYPVSGPAIKGVGGVQQFFEGMGLSKPPLLQLSQNEFRFTCKYKETVRGQATLQTSLKKWVYAQVASDAPWLKVLTPSISGPQHAAVQFEVDTNQWHHGPKSEGKITFTANGGQKLTLKVAVEVLGAPAIQKPKPAPPVIPTAPAKPVAASSSAISTVPSPTVPARPAAASSAAISTAPIPTAPIIAPTTAIPTATTAPDITTPLFAKFVPALLTTILLCLLMRVVMIPLVDLRGRSSAAAAAAKKLGVEPAENSSFEHLGGWLQLPWLAILGGADTTFSAKIFRPESDGELKTTDFRHYFASYFIRWFTLRFGWLGAIVGAIVVWRSGGKNLLDLIWGEIAGLFAGFVACATFTAFFLIGEMIPHTLWHITLGPRDGFFFLVLWSLLALFCWLIVGIGLGLIVPWIAPLRRLLIDPPQRLLAGLFRLVRLQSLADYWSPA